MSSKAPVVVKGRLSFKGSSVSRKRKAPEKDAGKEEEGHEVEAETAAEGGASSSSSGVTEGKGVGLTEAQRKHREKSAALETLQMKRLVGTSYRDRVESFNGKLARMTEHNDIPRISAAGNG
jgi:protein FAM32A